MKRLLIVGILAGVVNALLVPTFFHDDFTGDTLTFMRVPAFAIGLIGTYVLFRITKANLAFLGGCAIGVFTLSAVIAFQFEMFVAEWTLLLLTASLAALGLAFSEEERARSRGTES